MCQIYASTDPALYATQARSVRIDGVVTSVRLEAEFWAILERIAAEEGLTTPRFLSQLYSEKLAREGEIANFASLLRVVCTCYLARQAAACPSPSRLASLG
ncbi:ribbon-helix-helix domain-containing protein [Plasticicumulans acidivorans]|uniref:Putative DNA-binding ribbon-helix-helix protein n=1 Tax=Plasticicumulans acidivorans TaxID=886464 RepID=A0A317MTD4_9GAMM|nr:ribbon-helix-helix domain-containing protein [Plasticicumulans acidivorans]PWV60603.1 putative DNA-binding ribbon-helix-helix protein [Plasticicumulans acidivorans]